MAATSIAALERDALLEGLLAVAPALSTANGSVLQNVLLSATDDALQLAATDGELTIAYGLEAPGEGVVWRGAVAGAMLRDLLRALGAGEVTIGVEDSMLVLTQGTMSSRLAVTAAEDLPDIASALAERPGETYDTDPVAFAEAAEALYRYSAHQADAGPHITGVQFEGLPAGLQLAASDGVRGLLVLLGPDRAERHFPTPRRVRAAALRQLAGGLKRAGDEAPCSLGAGAARLHVETGPFRAALQYQEAQALPFTSLRGQAAAAGEAVAWPRGALLGACRRAAVYARRGAPKLRISRIPGGLHLLAYSALNEQYHEDLAIDGLPEAFPSEFVVHTRYLQEALELLRADTVRVRMAAPNAALFLDEEDGHALHVIMPLV
jgi:DNA polymerase III sliding clamp (beta) subunit (PCNA family)